MVCVQLGLAKRFAFVQPDSREQSVKIAMSCNAKMMESAEKINLAMPDASAQKISKVFDVKIAHAKVSAVDTASARYI